MDGKFILEGIRKGVVNTLNNKNHAEHGAYILNTSGSCPDGDYYAFTVGDSGVTISSIDYGDYVDLYDGTLTDFVFTSGQTYIIKFKAITISAGNLICWKV